MERVAFRGFSRNENQGHSLELLTMRYEAPHLHLIFAADAEIRLEMPEINVRLKDVDDAWPVMHEPEHKITRKGR